VIISNFTYAGVSVVDEHAKGWEHFSDGGDWGWRVFVATQVDQDPGDVAQEGERNLWLYEVEQRRHDALADHKVSEARSIAYNVAQSPYCLLADIWVR